MIDPSIASLAMLVLAFNSIAILGWARRPPQQQIKIKGRRYL